MITTSDNPCLTGTPKHNERTQEIPMTSTMTSTTGTYDAIADTTDLRSRRTARSTLPRRFDVHQVASVTDGLLEQGEIAATTVVDGSQVEMIDLAALRALEGLIEQIGGFRIVDPSVALSATIRFTGHERLGAVCVSDSLPEAA